MGTDDPTVYVDLDGAAEGAGGGDPALAILVILVMVGVVVALDLLTKWWRAYQTDRDPARADLRANARRESLWTPRRLRYSRQL